MNRVVKALLLLTLLGHTDWTAGQSPVTLIQKPGECTLANEHVRLVCRKDAQGFISQHYYAADREGAFREIIASFRPDYSAPATAKRTDTYNSRKFPFRYLLPEIKSEMSIDKGANSIIINGMQDDIVFTQSIRLDPGANEFYVDAEARFPKTTNQVDYVMSTYVSKLGRKPEFIHTPAVKFDNEESKQNAHKMLASRNQVIGDRAFQSPAIVVKDKSLFFALLPDLDKINQFKVLSPDARRTIWIPRNKFCVVEDPDKFSMPTALDYTLNSGISDEPVFAFGFMDAIISHHIHFNRTDDDSGTVRTINSDRLKYGFTLMLDARGEKGYGDVSRATWARYGHQEFTDGAHLAMPFYEYYRLEDSLIYIPVDDPNMDKPLPGYKNTGSWLEWEDNGVPMGGYRCAADFMNDKIQNTPFWNSIREASGLWYYGKKHDKPKDIERARRIINFALSAPQNEQGLFALQYNATSKSWTLQTMDPMQNKPMFQDKSTCYDIAAMCNSGNYFLNYYMNCTKDERIIKFLKPYGDWLLTVIDERGTVPAYVSEDMEISPILRYSAHPAASLWFLAELYNATKNKSYLNGAEKIAGYLEKEIIPGCKWVDFEQFYSCGRRPWTFDRDIAQNQWAKGNLAIIWATEGFGALHRATGSETAAVSGAACADYLAFSQCSWNPHYIYTAYPFGGFGVDNSDCATFLDARQAICVEPFAYWGKVLGRQDLIERAIAAARSSVVLINHPRHEVNGIYKYTNLYPFGFGPENIDHEASPISAMRTHTSWGEGSGVYTGLAEALRTLGSVYVNPEKNIAVGIDGILVKRIKVNGKNIELNLENLLSKNRLKMPWENPFAATIKIDSKETWNVTINGNKFRVINNSIELTVMPDGSFKQT
ncbi:MAG: hypothetical protein WC865_02980 [Bacteroidales bacterium]